MLTPQRIGIFGGTFDPPHMAHLEIVQEVLASGWVDRVLAVPCFQHAFDKVPVSFFHRLAMCRLLFAHCQDVEVSDIEQELDTPGRSLALVEALETKFPGSEFRLVVGADIYQERENWYRFDLVEKKAPPIYFGRKGVLEQADWLPAPANVSSNELRERLRRGQPTQGLLAESVLNYIVEHQLYGV